MTFFPSHCGYGWIPDNKNGIQHFLRCSALPKTSLTEFSLSLGYAWRQPYLSLKSHKMSEKEHGIEEIGKRENISLQADKVQSRTLPSFHGIVTTQKPDRFLSSFKKGSILI